MALPNTSGKFLAILPFSKNWKDIFVRKFDSLDEITQDKVIDLLYATWDSVCSVRIEEIRQQHKLYHEFQGKEFSVSNQEYREMAEHILKMLPIDSSQTVITAAESIMRVLYGFSE